MAERVGGIYYDVTLETGQMVDGQRRVVRELNKTNSSLDAFDSKLTATAAAVGVLASAYAAMKLAKLADEFRLLGARVEVAAGSIESGTTAFAALVAISRNTQSSLAGNIEVFARLNQSILQMGGTQADTLRMTELLSKAIKVSGASAVEAKSAMLQFGQAMGSGKLAGDELRSLMENAPYLMRQLADGIGVPMGALKKMGEEGKLTADVVTNALTKAAAKIDEDFKKFPQTIASAMQVAQDSAALAALKFDELSGTSAALTGTAKGLGEVLDKLADQFGAANSEAGILGRNDAVKSWADTTKIAISYLIDAVDVVWQTVSVLGRNVAYVFKGIGSDIGGIGAQVMAVVRGDFAGAVALHKEMIDDGIKRRAELDAADKKSLGRTKLAGQAMRDAWEQGAGGGRGTINPKSAASVLKPTASDKKPKKAGAKFDAQGYMAGLEANAVDEWAKIGIVETEAKRKADELLKEKKISHEQHEKAITLITADATKDRQKIMEYDFNKAVDAGNKREEEQKRQQELAMQYGAGLTRAVNPVDALRQEYQAKLEIVTQYEQMMAKAGVDATTQGQITRTQIESEYQLQRTALAERSFRSQSDANAFLMNSINAFSQTATSSIVGLINGTASATDVMRNLANVILNEAVSSLVQIGIQQVKNAFLGNTLAAADAARKAANGAVYAASVAAQVTGMSAMAAQNAFAATAAIPIIGPGLAPAAAAAAGAASAGIGAAALATAPLAGARQYGGPASAGSMYRVNETGAPEMFTAGNGNQYMMPTKSGKVTAADKVGGGGIVVSVSVDASGSSAQGNSTQATQLGNMIGNAVRGVLVQEKRPGGMLA